MFAATPAPASDTPDEDDHLSALPPPPVPGGSRPRIVEEPFDEWIAQMSDEGDRTAVYADGMGREVHLIHPGLVPPAAITLHDGVPAAPVEFILKGDDPTGDVPVAGQ